MFGKGVIAVAAALFCCSPGVHAGPITYQAQLFDGVAVAGVNNQDPDSQNNPVGAVYYSFFAKANDAVTIFGDRLAGHYDMAFYVFSGTYADTDEFGGDFLGLQAVNLVAFGDDEDSPNLPGPFGDPRVTFDAPVDGFYTVAVTNFASDGGPPNPFQIQADGVSAPAVPEPASVALLGMGAFCMAAWRRRRNVRAC